MFQVSYPIINDESRLPVYVTSVGIEYTEEAVSGRQSGDHMLLFTVEGMGEAVIDGKAHVLPAGSGIYVSAGTCFELRPLGSWNISWVTFRIGIAECREMLFLGQDWCFFDLSRSEEEHLRILYSLHDLVTLDAEYGGSRASALLYGLLIGLNALLGGRPWYPVQQNPALEAVLDYINENYTSDLSLEQLCRAAGGLSEQYLCRLFKQSTGMRPMEYMLCRRISAARVYLERTDLPISEVALRSGFHNTSYFYRNFRKFTGMSPLAYRQSMLGE